MLKNKSGLTGRERAVSTSKYRNLFLNIVSISATLLVVLAYFALLQNTSFWKNIAMTPEPDCCAVCGNGDGARYHAPALVNLATGMVWELEIYDNDPRRPWEIAEEQRWDDWVFRYLDGSATMSWSSVDHTNMVSIGTNAGKFDPAHFCRDCRALLAETSHEGYAILDLYDMESIQAFAVEDGAEYTIRDYTVSVCKNKDVDGLTVEVIGHLFGNE